MTWTLKYWPPPPICVDWMLHQILIGPYAKDKRTSAGSLTMLTNSLFKGPWNTNWTLSYKIPWLILTATFCHDSILRTTRKGREKLVCIGKSGWFISQLELNLISNYCKTWLKGRHRKTWEPIPTILWYLARKIQPASINISDVNTKSNGSF